MKDKVIVITGASSGIGAALAQQVSALGSKTVLVARRREPLEAVAQACSGPCLTVVADVTSRADVDGAVKKSLEHFGSIDVVVNNAGRGINRLVSALTDEDLDEMIRVNVKSVLYATQAVLPHFTERGQGHLINISSMLARVPFATIRSAYAASKAAMVSLSANLRMELAERYPNIFVSCVHPGVVATDFGLNVLHGGPDSRSFPNSQTADEVASVIVETIRVPRADVYTRPGGKELVLAYLGAEDLSAAERLPPFATFPSAQR